MKNNKGFVWLPILLVILGIVVVGGGAYYVMHQNAESQTSIYQPTNTSSQTAPAEKQTSTAQVIKIDSLISRDATGVYYLSYDDANQRPPVKMYVPSPDFTSFKPVGQMYTVQQTAKDGQVYKFAYYTDKQYVYFLQDRTDMSGETTYVDIITGADPTTFSVVDAMDTKDAKHTYTAAWGNAGGVSKYVISAKPLSTSISTYSNSQYGFSVQYPSLITLNPPCAEDRGTQYLCSSNTLISFYEKQPQVSSWFRDGYVAVVASTNSQAVASCDAASPIGKTSTATINGVQFTVNVEGDAAAGTEHSYTTYSTLKGGTCYTLIDDEYSYVDESGKYAISQAQSDLKAIVQSFQFIH